MSLLWISTRIQCSVLSWALVSSNQTLTYIKSMEYVGMSGPCSSHYWGNSSPKVCAVSVLDSWDYYSREQYLTAQHLALIVFLEWLYCVKDGWLTWNFSLPQIITRDKRKTYKPHNTFITDCCTLLIPFNTVRSNYNAIKIFFPAAIWHLCPAFCPTQTKSATLSPDLTEGKQQGFH